MVFPPDLGEKNSVVLSMRMQVILDSSFARPGSAPRWGGKKGEFRDWTSHRVEGLALVHSEHLHCFTLGIIKKLADQQKSIRAAPTFSVHKLTIQQVQTV